MSAFIDTLAEAEPKLRCPVQKGKYKFKVSMNFTIDKAPPVPSIFRKSGREMDTFTSRLETYSMIRGKKVQLTLLRIKSRIYLN
jgi:hypothetical protein